MTIVPAEKYQVVKAGQDGGCDVYTTASSGTFAEEVQAVRGYLSSTHAHRSISPTYTQSLPDIGNYSWFSNEQMAHAKTAIRGAIAAVANTRNEYLGVMLGALAELYHLDRALHAASLMQLEGPICSSEIAPVHGTRNSSALSWYQGNFGSLPAIVVLLEQEVPDRLLAVSYPRKPNQYPEIYAEYGNIFCVKVAEVK